MHPYQKHRESQREAGEDRYRKSGGRGPKSKHVSKHIHITVNKGGPGDLAGAAPLPPAGPMPAGVGPIPGAPAGGPMPMPPPGGMPPPPGMPPMKRGGKT